MANPFQVVRVRSDGILPEPATHNMTPDPDSVKGEVEGADLVRYPAGFKPYSLVSPVDDPELVEG